MSAASHPQVLASPFGGTPEGTPPLAAASDAPLPVSPPPFVNFGSSLVPQMPAGVVATAQGFPTATHTAAPGASIATSSQSSPPVGLAMPLTSPFQTPLARPSL